DRIVSVAGHPTSTYTEVSRYLHMSRPGQVVVLGVERGAEPLTFRATLGRPSGQEVRGWGRDRTDPVLESRRMCVLHAQGAWVFRARQYVPGVPGPDGPPGRWGAWCA